MSYNHGSVRSQFRDYGFSLIASTKHLDFDRKNAASGINTALTQLGSEMVWHFRGVIDTQGEGSWPGLSAGTLDRRAGAGITGDKAFAATGQIRKAIGWGFTGENGHIVVGVSGSYVAAPKYGTDHKNILDLVHLHEHGTSRMPPRPIFGHHSFHNAQAHAIHRFQRQVITNGWAINLDTLAKRAKHK